MLRAVQRPILASCWETRMLAFRCVCCEYQDCCLGLCLLLHVGLKSMYVYDHKYHSNAPTTFFCMCAWGGWGGGLERFVRSQVLLLHPCHIHLYLNQNLLFLYRCSTRCVSMPFHKEYHGKKSYLLHNLSHCICPSASYSSACP